MGTYGIDPAWGKEQHRLALIEQCYDPMTITRLTELRLLLHHLRGKQVEAVRRMASTLRRGGVLIASECYCGAMRASCTRAFAELWRGLYAALPDADYEWPVSLAATLQAAGLEARGDVGFVRGATPQAEILRLSVEAMRDRMPDDVDVEAGLEVLDDPTSFEPGIVWYPARGKRQ